MLAFESWNVGGGSRRELKNWSDVQESYNLWRRRWRQSIVIWSEIVFSSFSSEQRAKKSWIAVLL